MPPLESSPVAEHVRAGRQVLIEAMLARADWTPDPPGCVATFVEHPADRRQSLPVAIVWEHRFALHYWAKWRFDESVCRRCPDFVTVDFHNDLGTEGDIEPDVIASFDPTDSRMTPAFCWSILHPMNDGQICAAMRLDLVGHGHFLVKSLLGVQETKVIDRDGRVHNARFYRRSVDLLRAIERGAISAPVVLDIDLDYFTRTSASRALHDQAALGFDAVRKILDPEGPLMSQLLPMVVACSIALEPEYCGGLGNCLRLLCDVDEILFGGKLLGNGRRAKR